MFATIIAPGGLPPLAESWASTRENYCNAGFPKCPALGLGVKSVTYTEFYARDAEGFRERGGPISLLPAAENQVLVLRYDLAQQYLVWTDTTQHPPKVLNCTRAPIKPVPNQTLWKREFLGQLNHHLQDAQEADVSCKWNSTAATCQHWNWTGTFSDGCEGKAYWGTEPLNWLMAPTTAKGVFALTNVTNDILFPPGMPEECYFSGRHSNWYHQGYLSDWDPAPADDLFAVPPDADCPPAQSGHPLLDSPVEHVTLRGVLPLV